MYFVSGFLVQILQQKKRKLEAVSDHGWGKWKEKTKNDFVEFSQQILITARENDFFGVH